MAADSTMEKLVQDICQAITENRLNLPPLPETCLKVRNLLQDESCSARQLANTIAADTALAARIMKVANSAIYTRQQPTSDLHSAIQRLGNGLINSLVNGLAIMPMFTLANKQQQEIERQIKQHSISTAALAYALCQPHRHLNHFEGYLAAILKNIGYIAILSYHDLPRHILSDPVQLQDFLSSQHIPVGNHLLKYWQFPNSVIEIQEKQSFLFRSNSQRIDYLDIIIAANIINGPIFGTTDHKPPAFAHIPVMQRLNITEETLDDELTARQAAMQEARFIFQATP